MLSEILKKTVKKNDRNHTLVLGIPRAGVLTAEIVAKNLSIPNFDIIISRKLTDPDNKEQAIGAVVENGFTFIKHDLLKDLQITEEYLKKEITFQIQEIDKRKRKYNPGGQSNLIQERIKEHKIILLIDDGIATGATMMVAAKWIREFDKNSSNYKKRVIIASPVAPKNIIEQIRNECAVEVATVFHPSQGDFRSVEQYHQDFEQVTDDHIIKILKER
jgi:predicted phosphoribosyltransferase